MVFLTKSNNYQEILDLASTYKWKSLTSHYNVTDHTFLYIHDPYIYLSDILSFEAYPLTEKDFIKKVIQHENRLKQKVQLLASIKEDFPLSVTFSNRRELIDAIWRLYDECGISTLIGSIKSCKLFITSNGLGFVFDQLNQKELNPTTLTPNEFNLLFIKDANKKIILSRK